MAVAVVAALIPVFNSVAGDVLGYYMGRHLWFGFFAVYGIVVHVIKDSWSSIYQDFICHGNITDTCVAECFEQFLNVPVTGVWYNSFFVFMGLFFLLEFFMAGIRRQKIKASLVKSMGNEEDAECKVATQEWVPSPYNSPLNFHSEKMLLFSYLLYFLLQMVAQCELSYRLLYQHLPLVNQSTIHCSTDYCPGPNFCLLRGTAEKRMTIYTLMGLSILTIMVCLGFFLYSIQHYL